MITFFLPRFHTNLTGLIKGLLNDEQKIEIFALRAHSLENHTNLEPILLPKSALMFSREKQFEGPNFRAWDVPSLRKLYKKISRNKSQTIIVRLEKSMFSIVILGIALFKLKKQVLIYTQRAIPEENNLLRFIQAILYKFMNWKWISPVKKESYQAVIDHQCWIPFATNLSERLTFATDEQNILKIVTIGKLVSRKNLSLVIKIFQKLDSSSFALDIIAENSTMEHKRIKSNLNNMIKTGGKISLIENIDHLDVRKRLEQSHIFLLLSQNEPASVSNLEAMASGNLVIIGRDNGTANYIQDRKGGFIVDYNEEEILKILRRVEQNPSIIEEMGKINISEVAKNFEQSVVSEKLLKFINQVIID